MMFFKRYTSLLISTSIFVQSVSPAFAMDHDSVEKIEQNLSTLKKFSSTPVPQNFASDPEKTAAGVLHWAEKNGEVFILLGKRNDSKNPDMGEWCNAGGKSDAVDEGLTNTAEREVREELNGIYAHHARLLRKQPVTALYSPQKKDGLLHYMYWQKVQYLEPEIFNKKVNEATEGHSKEYTDFMWVKARDLLYTVVTQAPVMTVGDKTIEIFSPLFSTLSTDAGTTFLHELATHKKIRRFNKDVRPLCNRLYIEKDQNEPTTETIPGESISVHWVLPNTYHKPQAIAAEAIPFGQNGFGKWYTKRQLIGPDGEILSETPVFFDQKKEEDIFAEAVAAHGMAMVELKRRRPMARPQAEPSEQWNPHCDETLSRIHLRIVLGPDYKTPADFMTEPNSRRAADLANIRSYFKIDDEAEVEQKGNEFKREIKLVDSDYEFFADILGWEDENKQWPTFYHGASANLNNLFKSFTYLRELMDLRSFKELMALRGTDIYFKNTKTVWEMLKQTGAHENAATSPAMLFLNFVLLAGLKTTRTTSSSAEYVLNDHSVTEQNIAERFEEAMALAGFSKPEYAYFQSIFEQFIAHKNPTAGNSVMLAISQNPKDLDDYNYPTIGGSYYDPAHYNSEESSKSSATSAEEPSGSSDSKAEKLEKQTKKPQPIKSTLQILKGIQDEFERQQKDGIEPFTTNTPDKKSLFPENRVFLHPSHLMDPTHTKTKAFDRFPLTKAEQKAHDQEMRRTTIATMADWLAQKTAVMEGSFITEPVLKKLYKVAHHGMTHQEAIESPSHDGFLYLVRTGHLESIKRYLASYPEILKLIDQTALANATLESKNIEQIDFFLNNIFQGDWKVFLRENFKNKLGQTPLHLAVDAKHIGLVKAFLGSGLIDPNIQDDDGDTPLGLSLMSEGSNSKTTKLSKDIFKLLLADHRVDPNISADGWCSPLQQVIYSGDEDMIKLFLAHPKLNPNTVDKQGNTPLSNVMLFGQQNVIKFLISHPKIDLNIPNSWGQTPLLVAILNNNKELAKLLLADDRVDPNLSGNNGQTPLLTAIYNNQSAIPLLLAHNKLNPNIQDAYGHTPLSYATIRDEQELVKLLLACDKVDPNTADNSGQTPLSSAISMRNHNIIQLLLADDRVDPNTKDASGNTLLSQTIACGQQDIVTLLLSNKNTDPTIPDTYGQTPLWKALSIHGQLDIVTLLLADDRVDPNTKDASGNTPLSHAIARGQLDIVKLLLADERVNPNIITTYGTPLAWAIICGETWGKNATKDIVGLILSHPHFDVNAGDKNGQAPLEWAIASGYQDRVEILLSTNNIDINTTYKDGKTPLLKALSYGYTDIAKLLLSHPCIDVNAMDQSENIPFSMAINCGWKDLVKIFLTKKTLNPNVPTVCGRALFWAMFNAPDIVPFLIVHPNIDLNATNTDGYTPLLMAIPNHKDIAMSLLMQDKCDPNIKDEDGDSPLHRAIFYKDIDIVRALLQRGANLNALDDLGRTPLNYSRSIGADTIVELLSKAAAQIQTDAPQAIGPLPQVLANPNAVSTSSTSRIAALFGGQGGFKKPPVKK